MTCWLSDSCCCDPVFICILYLACIVYFTRYSDTWHLISDIWPVSHLTHGYYFYGDLTLAIMLYTQRLCSPCCHIHVNLCKSIIMEINCNNWTNLHHDGGNWWNQYAYVFIMVKYFATETWILPEGHQVFLWGVLAPLLQILHSGAYK